MKVFVVSLLLVIVAFYESSATTFTTCDDLETKATAVVSSVDVEGCPDGEDCVLNDGKKTITFKFTTSEDDGETKTFIHDVNNEQTSEYEITDYSKKPCLKSGILVCPLKKDKPYTYTDTFSVTVSEDVKSKVRFEIRNRSHKNIVCFDFAVKATKAS